jgi:hypothetical protein
MAFTPYAAGISATSNAVGGMRQQGGNIAIISSKSAILRQKLSTR